MVQTLLSVILLLIPSEALLYLMCSNATFPSSCDFEHFSLPRSDCFESPKYFATLCVRLGLPSPQLKREGCFAGFSFERCHHMVV